MSPSRRGFLAVMSRAPLVGAIAGRQLAEKAAADLAGVSVSGTGVSNGIPSQSGSITLDHKRAALANPLLRQQIVDLLYEQEREVIRIDPDLAVMRSFSLSAKIAYQRKRNVERRIDLLKNEWPWERMDKLLANGLTGVLRKVVGM